MNRWESRFVFYYWIIMFVALIYAIIIFTEMS